MEPKISEYIEKQPKPQSEVLTRLRTIIIEVVPSISEKIKYGEPYFGTRCYVVGLALKSYFSQKEGFEPLNYALI